MIRLEKGTSVRKKEELTKEDKELIQLALSTTYKRTVQNCLTKAKSEKCKKLLRDILNDHEFPWED